MNRWAYIIFVILFVEDVLSNQGYYDHFLKTQGSVTTPEGIFNGIIFESATLNFSSILNVQMFYIYMHVSDGFSCFACIRLFELFYAKLYQKTMCLNLMFYSVNTKIPRSGFKYYS